MVCLCLKLGLVSIRVFIIKTSIISYMKISVETRLLTLGYGGSVVIGGSGSSQVVAVIVVVLVVAATMRILVTAEVVEMVVDVTLPYFAHDAYSRVCH